MRPPLLSCLLILLYQLGWTHGLCNVHNGTATCHKLEDLKYIETQQLESLKISIEQDTLVPDELVNLDNLVHLDLSNGDLRKIDPGSFRSLTNLKSLNLGDNRIEYLQSTSLGGLFHLHSLNLRNNAIRQLPPTLVRLKTLKHLDIHGNPLVCNCATLKVRDLIVQNGVTVSKKVVCAGPGNMNGTSLMSPIAAIVCRFEKQDREMQRDQVHEGSGTGQESADAMEHEDEDEEKEPEHEQEEDEEDEEDEEEYVEVNNGTSEKPKEPEMETPFPTNATTASSAIAVSATPRTTTMTSSLQLDSDDEIFFDGDEKKDKHTSTTEISRREHEFKDSLFYPSSGDGDDGSGEGSGAMFSHYDEEKTDKNEESSFFSGTILDAFFGLLGTTAPPTKDPDLEEEQFIDASSTTKDMDDSHTVDSSDKDVSPTIVVPTFISIGSNVEVLKSANTESKSGNVKVDVDSLNDEQANTSPAKQSRKGMGSYVVLGILLAVVAGLIGFAAYRGKLCNKKRKRGDVENGTELKDMQKSLLPDIGNSTQPKIASNGNTENAPLVEGTPETDENAKADRHRKTQEDQETTPRPTNGIADHSDPVKPPRKLPLAQDSEQRPRVDVNSLRENFLADRTSAPHQVSQPAAPTNASNDSTTTHGEVPPLSPGAQRVKITLQENPDSVPKTPILITRTMAGENLVKTAP